MALQAGHPGVFAPRVKTYSAQSGFVYEYRFVSHQSDREGGRYRFSATVDRRSILDTIIFIPADAVQSWEVAESRTLTPTERYAVAKLALFAALDEAESPDRIPQPVTVDAARTRDILTMLDI
jgi:hypothetical protein